MTTNIHDYFVYLKVIEARDLAIDTSDGNVDPFIQLYIDGVKAPNLVSKAVRKSAEPKWYKEFRFPVGRANSWVRAKVAHRSAVKSELLLGFVEIPMHKLPLEGFNDFWAPLEPNGALHVQVQFLRLFTGRPSSGLRVPKASVPQKPIHEFRMALERARFYPGEIVKGCIVYNLNKPKSVNAIRLELYGRSIVQRRQSDVIIYGTTAPTCKTWFSTMVTFVGGNVSVWQELDAGCHLYPFEFVLPMEIAPSTPPTEASHTTYTATATLTAGGDSAYHSIALDICSPSSRFPRALQSFIPSDPGRLGPMPGIPGRPAPSLVWSGEEYTFGCRLVNRYPKSPATALLMAIKKQCFVNRIIRDETGTSTQRVEERPPGEPEIPLETTATNIYTSSDLFPIHPQKKWEGEITVKIPDGLSPSIHCTESPLIQVSYTLYVALRTSTSEVIPQFEYPIVVCNRNWGPEGIVPPIKPKGPPLSVFTVKKCTDPRYFPAMVPHYNETLNALVDFGRHMPDLPQSGFRMVMQEIPDSDSDPSYVLNSDDWSFGTIPYWIRDGDVQQSLHDAYYGTKTMFPKLHMYDSSAHPDDLPARANSFTQLRIDHKIPSSMLSLSYGPSSPRATASDGFIKFGRTTPSATPRSDTDSPRTNLDPPQPLKDSSDQLTSPAAPSPTQPRTTWRGSWAPTKSLVLSENATSSTTSSNRGSSAPTHGMGAPSPLSSSDPSSSSSTTPHPSSSSSWARAEIPQEISALGSDIPPT